MIDATVRRFTALGLLTFGLLLALQLGFLHSARAAERGGECAPPLAVGGNEDFGGRTAFMRGSLILDWGVGVNNFTDQSGGTYVARMSLSEGQFEWKIADQDWFYEYCTETPLLVNMVTNAPSFGCIFFNGTIDIPSNGCFEFEMTTDGNFPPDSVDVTFRPYEPPEIVLESGFEDDEMNASNRH